MCEALAASRILYDISLGVLHQNLEAREIIKKNNEANSIKTITVYL
jgi:hypothetical protein